WPARRVITHPHARAAEPLADRQPHAHVEPATVGYLDIVGHPDTVRHLVTEPDADADAGYHAHIDSAPLGDTILAQPGRDDAGPRLELRRGGAGGETTDRSDESCWSAGTRRAAACQDSDSSRSPRVRMSSVLAV